MDRMRCYKPRKVSVQETNNHQQLKDSLHQILLHHIRHDVEITKFFERAVEWFGRLAVGNKGDGCVNHHVIESRDYTQVKTTHRILTLRAELLLHELFDKRDPKSAPAGTL
jgi:hypothetical protein